MNECKDVNLIEVHNLLFSGDKKRFYTGTEGNPENNHKISQRILIIYKENNPK